MSLLCGKYGQKTLKRVSKSTVHKDLSQRLKPLDAELYAQVRAVLQDNKAERHLRGGQATRLKYSRMRRERAEH